MDKRTLEIKNLTKRYKSLLALDNFSITVNEGIFGLLGPNGAGKSTLMRCIADIIRPDEGEILYCGESIYAMGKRFRSILGFMPQEIGFYPMFSAIEIMQYFAELKNIKLTTKEIEEKLQNVNLYDVRKKRVGGFSGGMKRRLGIAVTLLNDPEVLILDEPTAGLDPEERIRLKALLRQMSKTKIVILATHIISDIESLCETIYFIQNGHLIKTLNDVRDDKQTQQSAVESTYLELFGNHGDNCV